MNDSNLIPKQITDKNGKITTVWVKPDQGGSKADSSMTSAPKMAGGGFTPSAEVAEVTAVASAADPDGEWVSAWQGSPGTDGYSEAELIDWTDSAYESYQGKITTVQAYSPAPQEGFPDYSVGAYEGDPGDGRIKDYGPIEGVEPEDGYYITDNGDRAGRIAAEVRKRSADYNAARG